MPDIIVEEKKNKLGLVKVKIPIRIDGYVYMTHTMPEDEVEGFVADATKNPRTAKSGDNIIGTVA